MKYRILFLFAILCSVSKAADVKSVLKKMNEKYAEKNVSFSAKYELFKGHKSNEVHSFYDGLTYSYEGETYQKIDNAEFVYAKDYFLKINHDERAMALSKGQQVINGTVDLDEALKECSSSKLIENGENYVIVFRFLATSSIPCSVIKVSVSKKKFLLKRMDLYYSYQQDFSNNFRVQDMHAPHLRVTYDSINFSPKVQKGKFDLTTYLSKENSILKPSGVCEGYELIDYRIK